MKTEIKILSFSLLAFLISFSSIDVKAQNHAQNFNLSINSTPIEKVKELGVFLSGVDGESKDYVFTKDKAWINFSKKAISLKPKFDKNAKLSMDWAERNLQKLKVDNVFYPYGQSDVTSSLTLFPNAKVYVITQSRPTNKTAINNSGNTKIIIEKKATSKNVSEVEGGENGLGGAVAYNRKFLELTKMGENYEKSAEYILKYEKNFFTSYDDNFQTSPEKEDLYTSSKALAQLNMLGAKITNIIFIHQNEFSQVWQPFYLYEKNSLNTNAQSSNNLITRIDFEIDNNKKSVYLVTYDRDFIFFDLFLRNAFQDKRFITLIKHLPDSYWSNGSIEQRLKKYMIEKSEAILTHEEGAQFLLSQEKTRRWQITGYKNLNPETGSVMSQLNADFINFNEFVGPDIVFKEELNAREGKTKIGNGSPWLIKRQNYKEFLLNRPK